METPYITIEENDEQKFQEISKSQKLQENFDLRRGHVEFKNEGLEEIEKIQIFKTDSISASPASEQELYQSFRGKLYKTLTKEQGFDFIDTLKPNTAYYYTFRTVDRHEQVSNPSEIYKITLTYNTGVYIPRIKVLDLQSLISSNQKSQKRMVRFLEIKGADIQTQPYEERDNEANLIQSHKGLIPDQANKITDNKFLVRLISRDSGKKINIVIDFDER